jgi:hypothetical protein
MTHCEPSGDRRLGSARIRIRLTVTCLAALSFVGVGCGGGDTESPPETVEETPAAPSRTEFIGQVDAICQKYATENDALNDRLTQLERGFSESDFEEGADLFREVADVTEEQFDRMKEVEPPEDAKAFRRYLSVATASIPLVRRVANQLDAGDLETVSVLSEKVSANSAKARRLAQSYGFRVCGAE